MFLFGCAAVLIGIAIVTFAVSGMLREYFRYVLLKLHYDAHDERVLPTLVQLQKSDKPIVFNYRPLSPPRRNTIDDTT